MIDLASTTSLLLGSLARPIAHFPALFAFSHSFEEGSRAIENAIFFFSLPLSTSEHSCPRLLGQHVSSRRFG
eukprot:1859614-Rhodomonas_salina.1